MLWGKMKRDRKTGKARGASIQNQKTRKGFVERVTCAELQDLGTQMNG